MTTVFADTFYFVALFGDDDADHQRATEIAKTLTAHVVTTDYILTEFLNTCSGIAFRTSAAEWVRRLRLDPTVTIIENSRSLWQKGFELFSQRPDKEWSLTDCISFTVMTDRKITDALTHDHHFKQAGFRVLL